MRSGLIFVLLIGLLVVFFPAPLLKYLSPQILKHTPILFVADHIHGNFVTGLTFRGVKVDSPQASATIDRLKVRLSWLPLLKKNIALDLVELDRPHVVIKLTEPKKEGTPPSPWNVSVNKARISDGAVLILNIDHSSGTSVEGIDAQLAYQKDHVQIDSLRLLVQNSTLTARGAADLSPINGNFVVESRGILDGTLTVKGSTTVASAILKGDWKGLRIEGEAALKRGQGQWTANISGDGLTAKSTGRISLPALQWDAHWDAALSSAATQQWLQQTASRISTSGTMKGMWPKADIDATLIANDLNINGTIFDSARINLHGSIPQHQLSLNIHSTNYSLVAAGTGGVKNKNWLVHWTTFDIHAIQNWKLVNPFDSVAGLNIFSVSKFHVVDGNAHLEAEVKMQKTTFQECRIKARGFDIGHLSRLGLVKFPVAGTAEATVNVEGTVKNPYGQTRLKIDDIDLDGVRVGSLEGLGHFSKQDVKIEHMTLTAVSGTATVSGLIAMPGKPGTAPEFDLHLNVTNLDLSPLLSRAPVKINSSQLNTRMKITYENKHFAAEGPLVLTAKTIEAPEQGVFLKDFVLDLTGEGSTLRINRGHAQTGEKAKGNLDITGTIERSKLDVALKANEFSFDSDSGISGKADIELALKGSVEEPNLIGDVRLVKVDVTPGPQKKKNKKEKAEEKSPPQPSSVAMNVKIHFDNNVWYKEKQTSIEAKGNVVVQKKPYEKVTLVGSVETIRGHYVFYGRTFKIEQATLRFLGDPDINPIIDVNALYVEDLSKTKIFLVITGTLQQPIIELTSEPAMEQTDIVSVLVTGKPMDDFAKSETNTEALTKTIVANYFAEQLRQQLQDTAQIDVLRVQLTDSQEADVTVGKNLSDRLYVGYGQTLGPNGERRVEAQYSLGHYWSLEGYTASEGKYIIDLLYRLGLK